ncbi:hypothetical protein [Ulvibacterium sp.]|uniref:hypothetical protein n=1 Tax=Ulvibacterium sp. TaxID=2665914 RepID=UPI003BAD8527
MKTTSAVSIFTENYKWTFSPSVRMVWNVPRENFLADSEMSDNLKISSSHGGVDNVAVQP